jgi:hypothetical protein
MNTPIVSRSSSKWRWIVGAGCLGVLAIVWLEWRTIRDLRQENQSLRAQAQPAATDAASQTPMVARGEAMELEQKDKLELLRLRNEVRQLREQVTRPAPNGTPGAVAPVLPVQTEGQHQAGEAQQLALAAMQGDSGALDKLARLAAAARTMATNEQSAARSDIRHAFETLGAEAGKGNAAGLQALWQALRIPDLQGFAVGALGQAAGLGNEEALKPLLDPEGYLVLRSSVTAALKPAADAGNVRAIQALAATAADQNQAGLWFLAAQGLETAAAAGNPTAIDSLAALAATQDQNVRKEATLALEAAARKNQPRAQEALRQLGWR